MPNKSKANAAQKSALKERIMSLMTAPPMAGSNVADPNATVEPPMAPPAPKREMQGPNPPSYYVPFDKQEQVSRDLRPVAYYEGGRYKSGNDEVDPSDPNFVYSDQGMYYEKPTKIVKKGQYAQKK
jgi:hypothetical protein